MSCLHAVPLGRVAIGRSVLSPGSWALSKSVSMWPLFSPSLAGPFRETLTVHNMQDAADRQEIVVKADVRKLVSFHLTAPPLDFGPRSTHGRKISR